MTASADITKFTNALKAALEKTGSKATLTAIAKEAIDIIVKRTRKGFGVQRTGGNIKQLKPLAASTIARRKRSKLSRFTTPTTSNLTFTGKMLDSLTFRFIKDGKIVIRAQGTENKNKVIWNSIDRPFLALGRAELREIVDSFGEALDANLKRTLTRL